MFGTLLTEERSIMNQFHDGNRTDGVVAIIETSVCMYNQEHKGQLCHSSIEPVELFALLR